MNLTRLRIENFKRFTDLTIDLSSFAGAPKLVLLIGANGSGKSNAVGLQARANDEFRGLIDRDFLGANEIEALRREQPNLFVLGYYSIESYLYHPLNLAALSPPGFDETEYRELLQARMAAVRDRVLMTLERSRKSYEVLKTLPQETKTRAMQEIAAATASGDFETFYPFLDMKNQRPGEYLAPFNLQRLDLARTAWMRDAMAAILGVT